LNNHISGGGSENTNIAVILFVKNIASQILNNIETNDEHLTTNTKYFNLTEDKKILYSPLYHEMNMNYDKFKQHAGTLINERNEMIHPSTRDIRSKAVICRNLITEHNLSDKLDFEMKILQSVINPKRVTRSMSLRNVSVLPTTPVVKTVNVNNNRWIRDS
jgi:hypothetical protein